MNSKCLDKRFSRDEVRSAYENGERDFSGTDLSGIDLSGTDLSGIDLRDTNLKRSNFSQTSLRGAQLNRSDCQRANFGGADLTSATLVEAQFDGALLENAILSEADCTHAYMAKANLKGAVLRSARFCIVDCSRADLESCDFTFANLANSSFRYANLRYTIFKSGQLAYANVSYADCTHADFRQARLDKCDMANAILAQADFRLADVLENQTANLTGAILDVPEGKQSWQKVGEWQGAKDTRFSIDAIGQQIAYGIDGHSVKVESMGTAPQRNRRLTVDFAPIVSVAFHDTENKLYSYLYQNSLSLWNTTEKEKEDELTGKPHAIAAIIITPQGQNALLFHPPQTDDLPIDCGTEQRRLPHGNFPGLTEAASPDGQLIARTTLETPYTVGIYRAKTHESLEPLASIQHQSNVQSVCFSPDGKLLASMSATETKVYNLADKKIESNARFYARVAPPRPHFCQSDLLVEYSFYEWLCKRQSGHRGQSAMGSDLVMSGDLTKVAQKFQTHFIQVWDIPTRKWLGYLPLEHRGDRLLSLNFDGSQLLTAFNNTIRLWDTATETVVQTFESNRRWIFPGLFTPDGQRIITGSNDGIIQIWDIHSGKALQTLHSLSDVQTLAIHLEKPLLLSGHYSQEVIVWDLTTGEEKHRFWPYGKESGHSISQVAFRPGYDQIVTCDRPGTIYLWNLPS